MPSCSNNTQHTFQFFSFTCILIFLGFFPFPFCCSKCFSQIKYYFVSWFSSNFQHTFNSFHLFFFFLGFYFLFCCCKFISQVKYYFFPSFSNNFQHKFNSFYIFSWSFIFLFVFVNLLVRSNNLQHNFNSLYLFWFFWSISFFL